jgi:hypothetical protein
MKKLKEENSYSVETCSPSFCDADGTARIKSRMRMEVMDAANRAKRGRGRCNVCDDRHARFSQAQRWSFLKTLSAFVHGLPQVSSHSL